MGTLLITHYTRILRYIKPDFVHVFVDGQVVEEGGPELADRLEEEGYDRYATGAGAATIAAAPPQHRPSKDFAMTEINAARTGLEDVEEALKDVIDPELGREHRGPRACCTA